MIYSLKLECEKLASEKIEIQRHYVMVSFYLHVFFSFIFFCLASRSFAFCDVCETIVFIACGMPEASIVIVQAVISLSLLFS